MVKLTLPLMNTCKGGNTASGNTFLNTKPNSSGGRSMVTRVAVRPSNRPKICDGSVRMGRSKRPSLPLVSLLSSLPVFLALGSEPLSSVEAFEAKESPPVGVEMPLRLVFLLVRSSVFCASVPFMSNRVKSPKGISRAAPSVGSSLIRSMIENTVRRALIMRASTLPKVAARSSRVTSGPMSEITGIGSVMKSMIGWIGSVIDLIWSMTGPRKSLRNSPALRLTLRNSTILRPCCTALPISESGTSVPAPRLPIDQSRKKSASMVGNTVVAPGTRSLFSATTISRSTVAWAARPATRPKLPSSPKLSLVSPGSAGLMMLTPKVTPSTLPRSVASICRKPSLPVITVPGRVTSILISSSLPSEMSKKKPSARLRPKPKANSQSITILILPSVSSPRPGMPMSRPMSRPASNRV